MKNLPQPLLNILADWQQWQLCEQPPTAEQIKAMPEGLTNQAFLLQLDSGNYVLRIASSNSEKLDINRHAEFQIHQCLAQAGLTAKIRYKAPDNSYWLRDYVEGRSLTAADLTMPNLRLMVQTLKQIHQLPVLLETPQLKIEDKAEHYWQMIEKNYSADVLKLRPELQHNLAGFPTGKLSLCHMDPTPANWIQTASGELVLLDWEYAAIGHPWWDIAALLQQAPLSQSEQQELLNSYGIHPDQNWCLAQAQMDYMTVLWYGAQNYWAENKLKQALKNLLGFSVLAEPSRLGV